MKSLSSERGVALITALLLSMLMSAMIAAFLSQVNADQASSGIERDQTQAYAAAHAGVEKLTADLGQLFAGNFSPTGPQVDAVAADALQPNLPGISYERPDNSSGYRITYTPDVNGNPTVANPQGSQIVAGPYAGLVGLITPYQIEVTARTDGNAEVKMRREFQTVAIPVFQFGLFSENDLSFFAGPNFAFGGKVHTNQNLFLKQDNGATLTLQDRVTAVGEVVRNRLANGMISHTGTVRMARAPGCPAAPTAINANCFNLGLTQGSVLDSIGSPENPNWADISMGTSNGWIRNGRTGARNLSLPIVSDGAEPVDLIRRPPVGENPASAIARQRFYSMATMRVLISDTAADLTTLPNAVGAPERLAGVVDPAAWGLGAMPGRIPATAPFAVSDGDRDWGDRTSMNTPRVDGWILVNMQQRDGTWINVTREILSLGFIGRRLSDGNFMTPDINNACREPHPNAILRFQRVSDRVAGAPQAPPLVDCGTDPATGLLTGANPERRYWPNVLYDAREGAPRDSIATNTTRMWWNGVMHYVELDVNNFRRWLGGTIGVSGNAGCANGAGGAGCPMDVTGFVVYFSDRRTNRNLGADGLVEPSAYTVAAGDVYGDDRESGEFGWEDNINTGSALSTPNGVLDAPFVDVQGNNRFSEDLNQNDALEVYGGQARLLPAAVGAGPWPAGVLISNTAACPTPVGNVYDLWNTPVDPDVARVNRAFFFRRALKLVNGGRGNLPRNGTQGLTVASENPVYVQGNYNACTNALPTNANGYTPACAGGVGFGNNPGVDHASAAIIADAVTFLSNRWNDIRSFNQPFNVANRPAATTWYRSAIIAGKHLNFPRPANNAGDHTDFGTDGGAHNFIRYIEGWGGQTLNYRGSLISFYTSRQAVGLYKCCDNVYGPPTRGYNFDTEFLIPTLLPPRTPMFRDLNTLTFRQILRPTQ
jgi:hypothetical protein